MSDAETTTTEPLPMSEWNARLFRRLQLAGLIPEGATYTPEPDPPPAPDTRQAPDD